MALLDTTVFIDLGGRGGKLRRAEAERVMNILLGAGNKVVTSRLNVAELYVGAELSDDPNKEKQAIAGYLQRIDVLEFDDASAKRYAAVRAYLQRRGRLVGDMDMLIAGIALANGEAIVTRNAGHFQAIPGLTVIAYG